MWLFYVCLFVSTSSIVYQWGACMCVYVRVRVCACAHVHVCVCVTLCMFWPENCGSAFINNNNNTVPGDPEDPNTKSHSGSHERLAHAACQWIVLVFYCETQYNVATNKPVNHCLITTLPWWNYSVIAHTGHINIVNMMLVLSLCLWDEHFKTQSLIRMQSKSTDWGS